MGNTQQQTTSLTKHKKEMKTKEKRDPFNTRRHTADGLQELKI
jgi:hypothetical protein